MLRIVIWNLFLDIGAKAKKILRLSFSVGVLSSLKILVAGGGGRLNLTLNLFINN